MNITYKILGEEECFESSLSSLGGCSDRGNDFGLDEWWHQFEIKATKDGISKKFTIEFQSSERTDGICYYSGDEVSLYSDDDFDDFCEYDSTIIDQLHNIAKSKALEDLESLLKNKKEI